MNQELPVDQVQDEQVPDDQVPDDQVPDDQVPDDQAPDDQAARGLTELLAELTSSQANAKTPVEERSQTSRPRTPMSFALRADLRDRLKRFRDEEGVINVSDVCNVAIERELDRLESGNAVRARLRVELIERHDPAWTMGYQEGRRWAEQVASWLEVTTFAIQYADRDVSVLHIPVSDFEQWSAFTGSFIAPRRDYGVDSSDAHGAPSFIAGRNDGMEDWEHRSWEMESYWRAWLDAVREVYDDNKEALPSVLDRVVPAVAAPGAPQQARVDPDDIPF